MTARNAKNSLGKLYTPTCVVFLGKYGKGSIGIKAFTECNLFSLVLQDITFTPPKGMPIVHC